MKKTVITFLILALTPLAIFSQPFSTQSQWEKFFINRIHDLDPIEGIWSRLETAKLYDLYNRLRDTKNFPISNIAIYKLGNVYKVYNITTVNNGEFQNAAMGEFQSSATAGIYLYEQFYNSVLRSTAVLTENGLLEYKLELPLSYEVKEKFGSGVKLIIEANCIKLFPKVEDYSKKQKSSGTGYAISSNGIIVTNNHVIDGANSIVVRGVNSDFNKTFKAKILITDKNNDLALIQIDDYEFTSLGTIPYTIKIGTVGVGENIFVLGYPLRATMGDEIKLTNGIISARTGFQGDITSYQISAPIQPGNSGGPLFDSQGNIIGIINAKLVGAENASYAVKASYLTNLIDLLPNPPRLQTLSLLTGKTLTQQVELVKKFVYIIETE